MSELGFLSTSGVWSSNSQTSGPTLTIRATNLLLLRSHLTSSRVRSMHFALWLMTVSISDQFSPPDHGTSSSAAAWGLCEIWGAAALGRFRLCSPAPSPENIHCQPLLPPYGLCGVWPWTSLPFHTHGLWWDVWLCPGHLNHMVCVPSSAVW